MTFQTFTGKQYLKIDIANNYGHDKLNWDDRIEWFDSNEHQLDKLLNESEEPALFYASCLAWNQSKNGIPSGYPISLDATASGLQILSVLTGCEKSAALCNVIDVGKRMDAYTAIYGFLLERIGDTAKIARDDVKQAVMTAFYSSKAEPRRVFGDGPVLTQFYKTLEDKAPGAWELNESYLAMWNPTALTNEWTLPDGFRVRDKIMGKEYQMVHMLNEPFEVVQKVNRPIEEGRSLGANTNHSIDGMVYRELNRRCNYNVDHITSILTIKGYRSMSINRPRDRKLIELWDHYEKSGFLSARIIDYLDDRNVGHVDYGMICALVNTFPPNPFEVLGIHDCFRCLPNYGNEMRMQYNTVLAQIASSNLLAFIVSQLLGKPVNVNKMGDLTQRILQTNYALS